MGGQPVGASPFVPWLRGGEEEGGGWAISAPHFPSPFLLAVTHACLGCNLWLVPGSFWVRCPLGEVGRHRGRGSQTI